MTFQGDPHAYSYDRQSQINAWQANPGAAGSMEYHGAVAGSSRGADPFQPYSQPHRSSPSQPVTAGRTQPASAQQYTPWAPVPTNAGTPSSRGGGVKLEDLMSNDSRTGGKNQPLSSMPLSVSASFDTRSQFSAGPQGAGAEKEKDKEREKANQQQGPSEFIKKLYKMLEEEQAQYGSSRAKKGEKGKRGSVGWGANGTSFVVWDMNEFTTKIL